MLAKGEGKIREHVCVYVCVCVVARGVPQQAVRWRAPV